MKPPSSTSLLLLFLITLALPTMAQDDHKKPYQGLLWKITGNGMEEPSYLYGTMHVSDKLAYHLSEDFFEGIQNSDAVALESSPSLWMEAIMNEEHFPSYSNLISDRMGLGLDLGSSFYEKAFGVHLPNDQRLSRILSRDNRLTQRLLFRRSPWGSGNFEESTYLDLFIFRAGKKYGKTIHSLEEFSTSSRLRYKAQRLSDDAGENTMKPSIFFDGENRSLGDLNRKAYRQGDLQKLDSVMRIASSEAFYKYMIVKRNRIMADNLDSLLEEKSVFTAIGAAHLAGDSGVIDMLRRKGYELKPLDRNFKEKSKASKKAKKKIEEEYRHRNYKTRYSEDSLFHVDLPGPLHTVKQMPGMREYLTPDLVNGIFYQIRRIDTYAPLTGKGASFHKRRLDSLLFENIPGEILERKELEMNGHPAFHIKNETVRGDVQEYRIVLTPLRILFFKAGGTNDVLEGKASKTFFGSLELDPVTDSSWKEYVPQQGGFKVSIPGRPLVHNPPTTDLDKEGTLRLQARDPKTGDYYLLMKRTLHDYEYLETDSFELAHLARKFAEQFDLEVKEELYGSFEGFPSVKFDLKKEGLDRRVQGRILIRGGEYYLLLASMRSERDSSRFLSSFSFRPFRYQRSFRSYTDTALHFSTRTIAPEEVPKYSLADIRRGFYENRNKEEHSETSFHSTRKDFGTYKPAEKLQVRFIDMKEFTSVKDTVHLWNSSADRLFEDDFELLKAWRPKGKDSSEIHYLHSDTNTQRVIRSRNIYHEGALFSIRHYTDTLKPVSPYVERFFSEFKPREDTSFGASIFEEKHPRFFDDIRSGDSSRVAKAMEQFYLLPFEGKWTDSLMHFIEDHSFDQQSRSLKAEAYSSLGWYDEHKGVIPFLKRAYSMEEGNSRMRFGILDGLAMMNDTASKRAILDLFEEQVPLTTSDDQIWDLVQLLKDSAKYAGPMVPGILKYAEFREFEYPIQDLVGTLVDSGVVEGKDYASYKERLLRDAQRQLRKQRASEKAAKSGGELDLLGSGSSYSYSDNGGNDLDQQEEILLDLASLLAPFHEEDPEVRKIFDGLMETSSDPLLFRSALLRLHHGMKVTDTVWSHFASQDMYRNLLYRRLKDMGREELFPEEQMDQELFARGDLYTFMNLNSEEDSLKFLERRKVSISGRKGYVYFFKTKREHSDDWNLSYTGLQPLDPEKVDPGHDIMASNEGTINERRDLSKLLDETVEEIELSERERISSSGRSYPFH